MFALPRIDQIIDPTAGCERLSFLDAYSGYHQIKMAVKDHEKTSFITPFGALCYVKNKLEDSSTSLGEELKDVRAQLAASVKENKELRVGIFSMCPNYL